MRKKLTVAKLWKILTGIHSNIWRVLLYFLFLHTRIKISACFFLCPKTTRLKKLQSQIAGCATYHKLPIWRRLLEVEKGYPENPKANKRCIYHCTVLCTMRFDRLLHFAVSWELNAFFYKTHVTFAMFGRHKPRMKMQHLRSSSRYLLLLFPSAIIKILEVSCV